MSASAQSDSRLIWQPVQEYFIRNQPGREVEHIAGTKRLNSFTAYTHLGTDFGFHGPAEHDIEWQRDEISVRLGQEPDAWAGMWHSLSGLARESARALNFAAAWPDFISAKYQSRISCLQLEVRGQGRVKLEIKSVGQETRWSQTIEVASSQLELIVVPLSPLSLPDAKLVNWTAEPGSDLHVSALRLGVETPAVPFDEYVVAASYAKLARCFDRDSSMVKDRAHLEDGAFESVASTGLFALATVAVSQPPLQMVSQEFAQKTLRSIQHAVKTLESPMGLLPHFVRRSASGYVIHPGTEYSTVDTAIYYHSLLLGAQVLRDDELTAELASSIDQIDFTKLRLPDGRLSHGLKDDGRTTLPHGWGDWGGETALVMMLEHISNENAPRRRMDRPGQAWQGTGFITEMQSLFYPDFDSDEPDALDGVRWMSARRRMLDAQRDYIRHTWPGSLAAKMGLYGLSAGEGVHGDRYHVGGVDLPDQSLIHPHYILMSAPLTVPTETYALLQRMEHAGYFTPWGMVEAISITGGNSYLPMAGSLNAAFETLGAWHLLAKQRGSTNSIHAASRLSPELRRAVQLFYPRTGDVPAISVQATGLKAPTETGGAH